MLRSDQIRCWRRTGLCSLLCLVVHGFAVAQTEAPAAPRKPAHASAASSAKTKHSTTAHASSKRTASKASARTSARTSAKKSKTSHGKKGTRQVAKKRGQQAIDSDRARAIQAALIREHYMEGEPSGSWDSATEAAMQRYQADQGWQSKTTPDSRALIKLGLGPSHDHLLNPEHAMTIPRLRRNHRRQTTSPSSREFQRDYRASSNRSW